MVLWNVSISLPTFVLTSGVGGVDRSPILLFHTRWSQVHSLPKTPSCLHKVWTVLQATQHFSLSFPNDEENKLPQYRFTCILTFPRDISGIQQWREKVPQGVLIINFYPPDAEMIYFTEGCFIKFKFQTQSKVNWIISSSLFLSFGALIYQTRTSIMAISQFL